MMQTLKKLNLLLTFNQLLSFIIIKNRLNILCLCLFLYLLYSNEAFSNEVINIEEQLTIADRIKSSHPKEFNNILKKLTSNKHLLSMDQKYHLSYFMAYQKSISGKLKEAIVIYKDIINSTADIELKFRANLTIINTYGITQDWTNGLVHLSILLKQLPNIKNKKIQTDGIALIAMFYNQIEQYNLGLKYSSILAKSMSNKRHQCIAAMITIESKLHLKQLTDNDSEIQDAIELCENEIIAVNYIRSYQAKLGLSNNKPTDAINALTPYLSQINTTKYPVLIVKVYSLLAEAYWMLGNLEKTEELALNTIKVGKDVKTNQPVVAAYNLLYKLAKKRSNHEETALKYHEVYAALDKAYINETKAKHLAFQLAVHKELEQKNQIALLNKKNDLLITEQSLAKTKAENTRFILIMLTAVLSVLLLWGYKLLKAHKRIKQLAEYDHLTGIFNRGHFTQVANTTLAYCENANQEVSIIMFDLDYFKSINDSYGHARGDWALKKVTSVCEQIGRKNDIFARLGGEEFCILLTCCDKDSAVDRAEACRKAIADIKTESSGFNFFITASFGITDTSTSGYALDQLLADADTATYSSKHIGRNQVTVFRPKMQTRVKTTEEQLNLNNSQPTV